MSVLVCRVLHCIACAVLSCVPVVLHYVDLCRVACVWCCRCIVLFCIVLYCNVSY